MKIKPLLMSFAALSLTGCALLQPRPGTWTRLSPEVLAFSGAIENGTDTEFFRLVTPETKRLQVRSYGGDVLIALKVARYISDHQLDLEVNEVCGSSCANYWFMAAHTKIVTTGAYIGFHGDVGSSLPYWDNPSAEVLDQAQKTVAEEKAFYQTVQIDSRIYAFSAAFTTYHKVGFWAPSPEELTCVGVTNLKMWFNPDSSTFVSANGWNRPVVKTSAQDTRVPRPQLCQTGSHP